MRAPSGIVKDIPADVVRSRGFIDEADNKAHFLLYTIYETTIASSTSQTVQLKPWSSIWGAPFQCCTTPGNAPIQS